MIYGWLKASEWNQEYIYVDSEACASMNRLESEQFKIESRVKQ